MEGMEEKLGAILGNPQMMQQIMSMAQSLGASQPPPQEKPPADTAVIQKMLPLIQGSGIDSNQRSLLAALSPYLSRERIDRLEKAMRAAKMAGIVSRLLGGGFHV